jgi:hypothetical protein
MKTNSWGDSLPGICGGDANSASQATRNPSRMLRWVVPAPPRKPQRRCIASVPSCRCGRRSPRPGRGPQGPSSGPDRRASPRSGPGSTRTRCAACLRDPQALGLSWPTRWGPPPELAPLQTYWFRVDSSSPQHNWVDAPARQAYSPSASLGSRLCRPSFLDSHRQNATASLLPCERTGFRGVHLPSSLKCFAWKAKPSRPTSLYTFPVSWPTPGSSL